MKFCKFCSMDHPLDNSHWYKKRGKLSVCKEWHRDFYIRNSPNRKRRKSTKDIAKDIFIIHKDAVTLAPGQVYINNNIEMKFIDSEYGEWMSDTRYVIDRGRRHPEFYANKKKERKKHRKIEREKARKKIHKFTEDSFKKELSTRNPYVILIGSFINTKTKTLFRDVKYGDWETTPASVLKGGRHRDRVKDLNKKRNRLSLQDVKERIAEKHGDTVSWPDGQIYRDCRDKAIFTDIEYGDWETVVSNVIHDGKAHPNRWVNKSRAEEEIRDFISELGIASTKIKKKFEIDILIPELKIGIEYHGLYWHSEINKSKFYHLDKMKWANDQGLLLLQIFEHEWSERSSQIKGRLKSILGLNSHRLYARKCQVEFINDHDATIFINKYHIQTTRKNRKSINIGLRYEGRVVAIGRFEGHHRDSSKTVMSRFVCKEGYSIAGGLSRILKHASKFLKKDIITWVDLRWSTGDSYLKSGWEQEGVLSPDYFYYKHVGNKAVSKQSRKKSSVNTPLGLTEKQHAENDGLYRVWDCGKIRYSYRYSDGGLVPDV